MARIEQKQNDWLEPMKEWIKVASTLVKIARDSNLQEKKVVAKEIFGSNLRLASRAVRGEPVFPYLSALRAAESVGKIPESLILVPGAGLEPARPKSQDFKSCVATSYTTRAYWIDSLIICLRLLFPFDVFKYFSRLIASFLDKKAS